MRAMTLAAPPLLSSDIYRYVWDGRVQLAGINPYRYMPDGIRTLQFLRDDAVYPHINRARLCARRFIRRPPQMVFALAAAVTPGVFGMKLMMLLFDALAIAALWRLLRIAGRNPAELLIYAWLPLPVWEFAGNAHIDAVAAGLLALALLVSVRGRVVWSGIRPGCCDADEVPAGGGAAGVLATAGLAVAGRRSRRRWRCCTCPMSASAGTCFGFLGGYASEEGFASGHGFFVLQLLDSIAALPDWAPRLYIVLALGVLACSALRFAFGRTHCRRRRPPVLALAGASGGDPRCRGPGRGFAALPVVFRLAGAAGVPGAAAQRAVDARRRTVAGAWRVRIPGRAWRGVWTCRSAGRVRSARSRMPAAPMPPPDRTERMMTATTLKDPRRYFEAVARARHAGDRAAGVPVPGGHQPLQSAVRDLPAHLRGARAAGRT